MERAEYRCVYEAGPVIRWERIDAIALTDTVDGGAPRLKTTVKMCRTDDAVHVRFECEDDHVVATYGKRDDPLYLEDVVEVFIDEQRAGTRYKEYEISPRNVVFDALIDKKPGERPIVHTEWDDAGLRSNVTTAEDGAWVCDIAFAIDSFDERPVSGTRWNVNFYRIDGDPEGNRHFYAWSPTGRIDFHRPEKFGTVLFA
ncbi:carbohydrate-binding family 9-like protein [Paenibacillus sp. GYB003]|uniref:carbohydrate-binding family 9-like protein n=1 Tax=Paenibacillus sp. GYB003 TaxID=2994392 RepID=UPI002F967BB7